MSRPKYTSVFARSLAKYASSDSYECVRRMRFAPKCNTSPGLAGGGGGGGVGSSYEDYSMTKDTEEKIM